jgi:hypothetical protein|uniref:hypothetical protein n=1 Tax=Prosthecobacter sp. TaxID=1965333 RepID=UPI0037850B5D
MKHRRSTLVACLLIAYVSAPYLAGIYQIGEREGPVIYPEGYHSFVFQMGHESFHHEKSRQSLDVWMYKRPFFYGLPRRLKSEQERLEFIEMVRRNKSPILPRLLEMNKLTKTTKAP